MTVLRPPPDPNSGHRVSGAAVSQGGRFDIREKAGIFIALMLIWLARTSPSPFLVNLPRAEQAGPSAESRRRPERLSKRKDKVEALRADSTGDRGNQSLQTFSTTSSRPKRSG